MSPDNNGNGRQASYTTYLNAQAGNDLSPHGHQIGHGNDGMGAVMNQFSTLALPAGPAMSTGSQASGHHGYCAGQDQQVAYQGYALPMHVGISQDTPYAYGMSGQYPVQGAFAPLSVPYHAVPYTPGRVSSYAERPNEVPSLENRRGSYSTTESNPATPFFGGSSERGGGARVAVMRSSYTTPSPEQIVIPGHVAKPTPIADEEILALLKKEPVIPQAVPAVFTPATHIKSIEQCLENRISGNRNVYIRGLHPTTDDDLLLKYASRFGKVEQSKAIIDTATGACKGYDIPRTGLTERC
jgi:hypothetical protein